MALAALEVQGLTYSYADGVAALRGISFSLAPGERVALLGPNGAGKSTLLWCLVGILHGQGRVTVGGLTLAPQTEVEIRRRLGLVFSEPDDQLFMPTINRDITFGPLAAGDSPQQAERKAREAIAEVDLEPRLLERGPHELSSGERRRAALATVLALSPSILALDEPTNSLDARGRAALATTLSRLPCAQLIATHDISLAAFLCRRALVLIEGTLAADLPMADLLQDRAALARFGLTASLRTSDGQTAVL